jgi:hypothetical protein
MTQMGLLRDLFHARRTPAGRDPASRARADLAMFREASFLRSDVETPDPAAMYRRYAFLMYFLGAARYISRQRGLDDRAFATVAQDMLRSVGATTGEVESTLADIAYASFKPRGREAFEEGLRVARDFQSGKDNNAAMRLSELLRHW